MFAPSSSNSEFIEIQNISETDTIDLSGFQIKYYTVSPDEIFSLNTDYELHPHQFAIIFEADYDFSNGLYKDTIPEAALIFVLDDNAFGSSGMSNSNDRTVYLLNSEDDTLDVHTYSADNENGYSDEKINLADSVWGNSIILNGTPGNRNSIESKEFDLAITNFSTIPNNVIIGKSAVAEIMVENLGTKIATEITVKLYKDINNDNFPQENELLISNPIANLEASDNLIIEETITNISKGINNFIAEVVFNNDELLENNVLSAFVYGIEINEVRGDLVINEIMYSPINDEPEWIEIFNTSKKSIFIKKYIIADKNDTAFTNSSGLLLEPNKYLIIADNNSISDIYPILDNVIITSLPTLNNSGDEIVIMDSLSRVIDSVAYASNWGGSNGNSLERINSEDDSNNPLNWGESITPTPGKINSISKKDRDVKIENVVVNPRTAALGDFVNILTKIKNIGKNEISFNLQLFNDLDNNFVKDDMLEESEMIILNTKDSLNYVFNYKISIDEIEKNFLIKINVEDDDSSNNSFWLKIYSGYEKFSIIINEIMYAPINNDPEWIELFNNSDNNIVFSKYKIADKNDTVTINSPNLVFEPNQYLVLADDSLIYNVYQDLENVIITNIPTLNNSDDEIIIMDSLSRIIDSVSYLSTWGGSNGNSVERVEPKDSSNDPNNWNESKYPTPGKINSVTQKDFNLSIDTIFTSPEYPVINDIVKFNVKIKNIGKNQLDFDLNLYEDINLDRILDNKLESSELISMSPEDFFIYNFNYEVKVIEHQQNFGVKINVSDDDSTDNELLFEMFPSYPTGSIIVNEIMYSPVNEEPEWIELFNNSEYDINIKNWLLGDVLTNPIFKPISTEDFYYPNNSYLVVTKNNSIFNFHRNIFSAVIELKFANLNNDEDGIVLKDNRNITIDSLHYFNDWGGTGGKSLERINNSHTSTNSNNWKSSMDIEGSTPGRINSVSPKQFDVLVGSISIIPNDPVKNDSIRIRTKIYNFGHSDVENFSIDFYYGPIFSNTKLETQSNLFLASNDSLILTSEKQLEILDTIFISVNISLSEDEDIVNNYFEKQFVAGFNKNSVLINEIMFKPSSGKPEWIEIINNSDSTIGLQNWSIGDLSNKSLVTQEEIRIAPNSLIVISDYSNNANFYPDVTVIQTDLPNLSNTKDAAVLYDFRNAVIDSTFYNFSFFPEDVSLERISLDSVSTNNSNWTYSLDESRSTPGEENSIIGIPDYNYNEVIINEIMFNPSDANSEFIELFNNSDRVIQIGGWKIEDDKGDYFIISLSPLLLEPQEYFVVASDSSIVNYYPWLLANDKLNVLNVSSLNLTNEGKLIYIKDIKNYIIDSLEYSEKWHNSNLIDTKNISLELINSKTNRILGDNWSSSVSKEGATPGKVNSIFVENLANSSKLNISPNPFSPDNDGFEDFTIINYNLTQPIAQIRIRVFDSKGRLVRTLNNNSPSGSQGSIIFDGLDINNKPLKMGIYIVLFEAVNSSSSTIETIKEVVVVARRL